MSYDLTTDRGKVRLLIQDTASTIFTDTEVDSFLTMAENQVPAAAGMALRAIAANKALLAKYKQAGKYSEDTRQIYKALMELAERVESGAAVPHEAHIEQTFGDVNDPLGGKQEREFLDSKSVREGTDT